MNKNNFLGFLEFKSFRYLGIFCIAVSVIIPIHFTEAETHIGYKVLNTDTVWDKANSPYILDDSVIVGAGKTLRISAGVKVVKNTANFNSPMLYIDRGNLIIEGSASDRVSIDGLRAVTVKGGTVNVAYTDFTNLGMVSLAQTTGSIASSTISNNFNGLLIKDGSVKIWNSRIADNSYGIDVSTYSAPLLMMNDNSNGDSDFDIGGIGNALDSGISPILSITNSVIANNKYTGLGNSSSVPVYAMNNWWGTESGPARIGQNKISGSVNFDPWLAIDPALAPVTIEPVCCSNILFLPGLEGSYIYRDEKLPLGLGTTTNTLWLPNRNEDVRKLFLDENGSSTDTAIYSGDPIGKAYGLKNIYGGFMNFLDGLSQNGTVNEWKSFAYDWRKSISEVVMSGEKKATTTEYLLKSVEELASRSRTGKVTLIAHSNGGLVAKYLVKTLEEIGKSDLIDSVISVAVPYLGTPQALAGLLHGDGQSLGFGLLTTQAVARQMGQNMASAYSLLPGAKYFSKIFSPTIVFASTTVIGANDGSYPVTVTSNTDQTAFVEDVSGVRTGGDISNTDLPIIGNKILTVAGNVLHSILDPYTWPVNIARWAIVGWNANTTKGLNYFNNIVCKKSPSLPSCVTLLAHNASTTTMGDGTVVAKSAVYESGIVASADLETVSSQEGSDISHANILESKAAQQAIEGMIKNGQSKEPFTLPKGVSWGEPDYSRDVADTELEISTHSPVELHIYDELGRHTGIIPNPPDQDIEEGFMVFYEEKIPRSKFRMQERGGVEKETYISLPDNGMKYSIEVKGTGFGDFTLMAERKRGDDVLEHVEYTNSPVMPITIATTSIEVAPFVDKIASNLASSTNPLIIDFDGNDIADMAIKSGADFYATDFDWIQYMKTLKNIVASLSENDKDSKQLINKIDKLEKSIEKGKVKQVTDNTNKFIKKVGNKKFKNLNSADKRQIIDMINLFVAQYE